MLRIISCGCFLLLVALLLPQGGFAADYDALIKEGVKAKNAGQYEEAMKRFEEAKAINDKSSEVWYLEGVVLSFQKKYDEAITHLKKAIALDATNTDAKLHLAKVENWKEGITKAPGADSYRWQVDTGYGSSRFSRREQENWRDGFLQLNYKTEDGASMLHGKYQIARRFSTYNHYYEAGAEHTFAPGVSGYLALGGSPEADFLPEWRILGGGAYRIFHRDPLLGDTVVTLDAIYDDYKTGGTINTINPGVQYYVNEGIWLTGKYINVINADGDRTTGWFFRTDWQALPNLRLNAGAANAPDTVNGTVVDTRSRFLGVVINLTDATTLYLGYSRDDRENSYINKTISSGLSVKF